MPVVLDESEIKIEWTDINTRLRRRHPSKPAARSSGIHVSGILKSVLTKTGYLKPRDNGASDEMPLNMAIGMAWEDWAVGLWPDMKWQPGEVSLDGIHGSPDGISVESTGKMLEEFKATWKSSATRTNILNERMWMWQLMAYCRMLKLTKARLHVLWINGTYHPPTPRYATYTIQFSEQELRQFWEGVMLKNKADAEPEKH